MHSELDELKTLDAWYIVRSMIVTTTPQPYLNSCVTLRVTEFLSTKRTNSPSQPADPDHSTT